MEGVLPPMRLRVAYAGVVFLSAFLLFVAEPMAAKQLLPVLGGSSSVWVTSLVFFQTALLAGYVYARWRGQGRWHCWMFAGVVLALAALLAAWWMSRNGGVVWADAGRPITTIFLTLGVRIGLPFVLLSSTSPLLQVWWTRTTGAGVPYRLFALSNAGSLLALAMYPAVIEPHLTLSQQRTCWVAGFILYAAAVSWLGMQVPSTSREMAIEASGASSSSFAGNGFCCRWWRRRSLQRSPTT